MNLVRSIAAAAIPAAIAVVLAPVGVVVLVPVAAAVVAAFACRGRTAPWLFAMLLAAIATLAGTRARELVDATMRPDAWPSIDLAREPMPEQPPRWIAVTGVLRDGFVLAEYDTPQGAIPDQSKPADAVLVPMTGSEDPSVRLVGAVVVARVRDRPRGMVTLRGRTETLAPELLDTIVDLGGGDAREVPGVLLDTLAVPSPREAWMAIGVFVLLVAGSAVAYALGRRPL
jgi:hypothetical protein